MATITAANAVFMLGVESIYPTPQQLIGFGVDDAFTVNVLDIAETQVGVDGFGVSGYVPQSPVMTIRLLASSPSIDIFENWMASMQDLQEILYANAVISQPSVRRKYTCYVGTLMQVSTMADVRKVLQNREFHIQWLPQGTIPAISAAPL